MADTSDSTEAIWVDANGHMHVKVTLTARSLPLVLRSQEGAGTGKRRGRKHGPHVWTPFLAAASIAPLVYYDCPVHTCYRNTRFGCELSRCWWRDRSRKEQ